MTHKPVITDNYILITSDEEIKEGDYTYNGTDTPYCWTINDVEDSLYNPGAVDGNGCKKIIAHLPLNNAPQLEGVPLLPPLPSGEDDVRKLADTSWEAINNGDIHDELFYKKGYTIGHQTCKENYRFTEEDMLGFSKWLNEYWRREKTGWRHVGDFYRNSKLEKTENLMSFYIKSLLQPKLPIGFKCEMGTKYSEDGTSELHPIIVVNQDGQNVMLGEWIY